MRFFSTKTGEMSTTSMEWRALKVEVPAVQVEWMIFSACSWEVAEEVALPRRESLELSHKLSRSMSAWLMCIMERLWKSRLIAKEFAELAMVLEELTLPPSKPVLPVKVEE